MADPLITYATKRTEEGRKNVFLFKEDCNNIKKYLQFVRGSASGSSTAGAGATNSQQRGAGAGATALAGTRFKPSFVKKAFELVDGSSGDVLCRRVVRQSECILAPVTAVEDLFELVQSEHVRLGHPGYEPLFEQVSSGSSYVANCERVHIIFCPIAAALQAHCDHHTFQRWHHAAAAWPGWL